MSWENKFTSILRETEANLSKARKKFTGGPPVTHHDWKYRKLSLPMKRSSSLLDFSSPSFYQSGYMSGPLSKSTGPPLNLPSTPHSVDLYNTNTDPSFVQSLHNKLDQQNKLIDQLMQMVNKLENERHNYGEQIREMKGDLYQLGIRVSDIKSDPGLGRRIEQIKQELIGEIQNLHSELQMSQVRGDTIQLPGKQVQTLSRDILDVRHTLKDDMDVVRREIDGLKSRIVGVEMDVSSSITTNREKEWKQDRLEKASREQSLSLKSLASNPSSWNSVGGGYQSLEKMQIEDLRTTVRLLKDKVDNMERGTSRDVTPRIYPQTTSQQFSYRNGTMQNTPKRFTADDFMMNKTTMNGEMDLDDLTLSEDDESTDFEMFNNDNVTRKKQKDLDLEVNLDTDDDADEGDLDLDDLNLSEDDLDNDLTLSDDL